jgi:hypothetical protein
MPTGESVTVADGRLRPTPTPEEASAELVDEESDEEIGLDYPPGAFQSGGGFADRRRVESGAGY